LKLAYFDINLFSYKLYYLMNFIDIVVFALKFIFLSNNI